MMEYFEAKHVLTTTESDHLGFWRMDSIFNSMQELACCHSDLLGCGRETTLETLNAVWMVVRAHICMYKYPMVHDEIALKTWPGVTGRISYPRYFDIHSNKGELLGVAATSWVLTKMDTRRVLLPRSANIELPDTGHIVSALDEPKKLKLSIANGVTTQRTASYSDLDNNKHVNNAKYVQWIGDLFSCATYDNKHLREFTIQFSSEVLPDEEVQIVLANSGSSFEVVGTSNDKAAFEAVGTWMNN